MRLQGAGIELRQQQQAIQHLGDGAHASLQLRELALCAGGRGALQLLQRQVHRLQRLPQVVTGRSQQAVLRANRAVGLLHQPDHFGGHLPALLRAVLETGLQSFDLTQEGRAQRRKRVVHLGWHGACLDRRCRRTRVASDAAEDPGTRSRGAQHARAEAETLRALTPAEAVERIKQTRAAEEARRERPDTAEVRTTIDARIQTALERLLDEQRRTLGEGDMAVVVIENASMKTIAYAGSSDFWGDNGQIDLARSARSPGC